MAGRGAVLGAVDVCLQMLDAHAHGKRLALERDACASEQLEDVARGVTAGEHEAVACDALLHDKPALAALLEHRGAHARRRGASRDLDVREPTAVAHLATQLGDTAADVVHDAGQDVGADVGLRVPGDVLGRPCRNERVEHEPVQRALCARRELAVRERAGAARAELDVALAVELARLVEAGHGLAAAGRVVTALDEQGLETGIGKRKRAEQPRAARTHDDGPCGLAAPDACRQRGRRRHDLANSSAFSAAREACEQRALGVLPAAQRDAHGAREVDVALPARVDGAAAQRHARDVVWRGVQAPQHGAAQSPLLGGLRAVELVEREPEV